jgi:16S rRNA processing protein RimM
VTEHLVEIGRIGRAHGVRGAVHVVLSTDRAERMAEGSRLYDGTEWRIVASARQQPSGSWLTHFEGLGTREAAEVLSGRVLSAAPIDDPDALWVHELIGAEVRDVGGVSHGRCIAVIDNPAHDLLELDSGALVPVVFVRSNRDGVITIDPPEGLFDLG